MSEPQPLPLHFGPDGLIPAVIQDADSGQVLMVAFMNAEALRLTRETGRTHFWSRSRGKIWRKGETSDHEQIVTEILVNCELNSVLVKVQQIGPACHDGYATCFYRRLEGDNHLTVISQRILDPALIYGEVAQDLAAQSRLWYGAYEYLREQELDSVSSTSRRLHDPRAAFASRIAGELRELAGVLDGTHRHGEPSQDVVLEASQVLYWVVLEAIRARLPWERVRPDRALLTATEELSPGSVAKMLRSDAAQWETKPPSQGDLAARCHATMALAGQACLVLGIQPAAALDADLQDLQNKPYLHGYFQESRTVNG